MAHSDTQPENEEAAVNFPKFNVVLDSSDHHYLGHNAVKNSSTGRFQRKIMQEWKILQERLHDHSIYVRVYEDRIDLMRAVIVGAAGTPYHDGLYFFDIAFPSNYPSQPPKVYYKSFGFRINPNLYASGLVCLSLLNTWHGDRREEWNPNKSTVLQVLLSIQALVLNEKPFFNEPGYKKSQGQPVFETKSDLYNEHVFVLCCKTILLHLRNPCQHFDAFVAGHFEERRHVILSACIAYANGEAIIGHYNSTSTSSSSSFVKVSETFKSSMQQLNTQLSAAFAKNEASLGTLIEQFKAETKTTPFVVVEEKKNINDGLAKKVFGKLKKFLHL